MIDQQLPPVPTPPHPERRRRRWRVVGLVSLGVVAGLLTGAVGLALLLSASALAGPHPSGGGRSHTEQERLRRAAAPPADQVSSTPVVTPDAEGAAAAARAFVAAYEHGYRTGDFAGFAAAQAPSCSTCQEFAAPVQEAQARRARLGEPEMDAPVLTVVGTDGEAALVHTTVDVSELVVHRSDGTQGSVPGYRAETDLYLVWSGDRWQVAALDGDAWCLQFNALTPET